MRTHIPERLLQIDTDTRTVLATNKNRDLLVYLYFTEPVVNSTAEVFNSLNASQGTLVSISGNSLGQRRFGYQVRSAFRTNYVAILLNCDRNNHTNPIYFLTVTCLPLQLTNIPEVAIVTVSLHSDLVLSRQGTPVASVAPVTFLYGIYSVFAFRLPEYTTILLIMSNDISLFESPCQRTF